MEELTASQKIKKKSSNIFRVILENFKKKKGILATFFGKFLLLENIAKIFRKLS